MIKYNIKNIDNKDNQLMIELDNKLMFISYKTIVFTYNYDTNELEFDANEYTYTKTTCKYLTQALEELNRATNYKSNYINNLCYNSKNRKQDILKHNLIIID